MKLHWLLSLCLLAMSLQVDTDVALSVSTRSADTSAAPQGVPGHVYAHVLAQRIRSGRVSVDLSDGHLEPVKTAGARRILVRAMAAVSYHGLPVIFPFQNRMGLSSTNSQLNSWWYNANSCWIKSLAGEILASNKSASNGVLVHTPTEICVMCLSLLPCTCRVAVSCIGSIHLTPADTRHGSVAPCRSKAQAETGADSMQPHRPPDAIGRHSHRLCTRSGLVYAQRSCSLLCRCSNRRTCQLSASPVVRSRAAAQPAAWQRQSSAPLAQRRAPPSRSEATGSNLTAMPAACAFVSVLVPPAWQRRAHGGNSGSNTVTGAAALPDGSKEETASSSCRP